MMKRREFITLLGKIGVPPSVLCWFALPLVSALGSTDSAADCSVLFAGFSAIMAKSDFPHPCIIGSGSSPSRCGFYAFSRSCLHWWSEKKAYPFLKIE